MQRYQSRVTVYFDNTTKEISLSTWALQVPYDNPLFGCHKINCFLLMEMKDHYYLLVEGPPYNCLWLGGGAFTSLNISLFQLWLLPFIMTSTLHNNHRVKVILTAPSISFSSHFTLSTTSTAVYFNENKLNE